MPEDMPHGAEHPILPRTMVRYRMDGSLDERALPEKLTGPARAYVSEVAKDQAHEFRCIAIAVGHEDGLTTAADMVEEAVTADGPTRRPTVVRLAGRPGEDTQPLIFSLLSKRATVRAAREAGIPLPSHRTRNVILLVGIVLVATPSLLTGFIGYGGTAGSMAAFLNPSGLIGGVVMAVVTVVAQLMTGMQQRSKPNALQKITDELRKQPEQVVRAFVSHAATLFAPAGRFRCVLIDDHSRLDRITQRVLGEYLRAGTGEFPELWVVLDVRTSEGRGDFSRHLAELTQRAGHRRQPYAVRQTSFFDLSPLTLLERAELADAVGHPERAGFATVKAIVAEGADTMATYFRQMASPEAVAVSPERHRALELLYLLSLTGVGGGSVEWRPSNLRSKLAQSRMRTEVLRVLLTSSAISPDRLKARLAVMRSDFTTAVTVDGAGASALISVTTDAAHELESHYTSYGLADPRLGHLFWALYRYDFKNLVPGDAFWVRKLVAHLVRSATPAELPAPLEPQRHKIASTLFQALRYAVTSSLNLGQLDNVVTLVERAHEVMDRDDPSRAAELIKLARHAYSALGADSILRLLLDLQPRSDDAQPAPRRSVGDSLLVLFAQATGSWIDIDDDSPVFAPGGRLYGMRGDIELMAVWLALSLQPFLTPEATALERSVNLAHTTLPDVAERAVELCAEDPSQREAAELASLGLAAWCWAMSGERSRRPGPLADDADDADDLDDPVGRRITDALESTFLVAADVSSAGAPDSTDSTLDLMRDGLAEELLTLTAAAAIVVRLRWNEVPKEIRGRLNGVIRDSVTQLGIAEPASFRRGDLVRLASVLANRMRLMEVTWRALGYAHFATCTGVRRLQFMTILSLDADRQRSTATTGRGIIDAGERSGLMGLLASLASAERSMRSMEVSAEILTLGTAIALRGSLGEEFAAQLCLLSLAAAHPFDAPIAEVACYLLGRGADGPGRIRLDVLLDDIADDRINSVALWLVNASSRKNVDGSAVVAALTRRVDRIDDVETRTTVANVVDATVLRSRIDSGEAVPVGDVLDSWESRRTSATYPFVLFLLYSNVNGAVPDRLATETAKVLDQFQSYLSHSGVVLLAAMVATRYRSGGAVERSTVDAAATVLRVAVAALPADLPVDIAILSLRFLCEFDAEQADLYREQLDRWRQRQLELMEERELSRLLSAGGFAILLVAYWRIFQDYGLHALYAADAPRTPKDAAQLRATAAEPLFRGEHGLALSAEFISDVEQLFGPDYRDDHSLDGVRDDFDAAAAKAMPGVFALMTDLSGVPDGIRAILRRHKDKVLRTNVKVVPDPATAD